MLGAVKNVTTGSLFSGRHQTSKSCVLRPWSLPQGLGSTQRGAPGSAWLGAAPKVGRPGIQIRGHRHLSLSPRLQHRAGKEVEAWPQPSPLGKAAKHSRAPSLGGRKRPPLSSLARTPGTEPGVLRSIPPPPPARRDLFSLQSS